MLQSARLADLEALLRADKFEARALTRPHGPTSLTPSPTITLIRIRYSAIPSTAQVHTDGSGALYATKGILGRMAPIGVHAGLIFTLVRGFCTQHASLHCACTHRGRRCVTDVGMR